MKIWELLTEEYLDQVVSNDDDTVQVVIKKNEQGDIVLNNIQGQNVAISKALLETKWKVVEMIGWERAMGNSAYYFIDETGRVRNSNEDLTIKEELRHENLNYFTTKEKAKQVKDIEFINRKLMKFADENNSKTDIVIDWKNAHQAKYYLAFNPLTDDIEVCGTTTKRLVGVVYFVTEEIAQGALEFAIKELREYYR